MDTSIKITLKKAVTRFDLADFNKKANEVFNNQVKPQIEKAKTSQKPLNTIKCNNPV